MSDDTQDLLEFGSIEVYYIGWHRPNATYYLAEMSANLDRLAWTKVKNNAFYWYTEKEAKKHKRAIGRNRSGLNIVQGEVDLMEDIELELP
jgi:hypothetical protein